MKLDRRWLLPLTLILAAFFLYFSFPLLVMGIHSLLTVLILGGTILGALPQILWWILGGMFLVLWGLKVIIQLGSRELEGKKEARIHLPFSGRLRAIYRTLFRSELGWYSQNEVRNLLQSRAIDLIALKLDISEKEAQRRFQKGDWTEDPLLKTYFSEDRNREPEKHGLWRRFMKSKRPNVLAAARNVLERLEAYDDFPERKGKHEPTHINS